MSQEHDVYGFQEDEKFAFDFSPEDVAQQQVNAPATASTASNPVEEPVVTPQVNEEATVTPPTSSSLSQNVETLVVQVPQPATEPTSSDPAQPEVQPLPKHNAPAEDSDMDEVDEEAEAEKIEQSQNSQDPVEPVEKPTQPEEPVEPVKEEIEHQTTDSTEAVPSEVTATSDAQVISPEVEPSAEPVVAVQTPSESPTEAPQESTPKMEETLDSYEPPSTEGAPLEEEEEDDEYDPTEGIVLEAPGSTPAIAPGAVPVPASPSPVPPPASTTGPTSESSLADQVILKALTMKLLADPTFTVLSEAEKQARLLSEFAALRTHLAVPSPVPAPAVPQPAPTVRKRAPLPPQEHAFPQNSQNSQFGQQTGFQHRQRSAPPAYSDGFENSKSRNSRAQQDDFPSHRPNLKTPMTPQEVQEYHEFLNNEAKYDPKVYNHRPGTRLFVGNVPTNHVEKVDMWRIFRVHGKVLQVSLKSAYCFIQYEYPDATERAIAAESIPLFGKVMVLEVASGAKKTGGAQGNETGGRDKRQRSEEPGYGKDSRRRAIDVQILVKPEGSMDFGREVAREFENFGLATDYKFVAPAQNLDDMISDAAYAGVVSVILIGRGSNLDLQVYEETPDGGIRFDEYVSLSIRDALTLVGRAKDKRAHSAPPPQQSHGNRSNDGFGNRRRGGGGKGEHLNHKQRHQRERDQRRRGLGPSKQKNNAYQPPVDDRLKPLQNLSPQEIQSLVGLVQSGAAGSSMNNGYQPPPQNNYQQPQSYPQHQPPAPQAAASSKVQSLLESLAKMKQ